MSDTKDTPRTIMGYESHNLFKFLEKEAMLGYGDSNYYALVSMNVTITKLFSHTEEILDDLKETIPNLQLKLLREAVKRSLQISGISPKEMKMNEQDNVNASTQPQQSMLLYAKYNFPEETEIKVYFGSTNGEYISEDGFPVQESSEGKRENSDIRTCDIPRLTSLDIWKKYSNNSIQLEVGEEYTALNGMRLVRSKENQFRFEVPINTGLGEHFIQNDIYFTYIFDLN